tara:strand:+ start:357 stop:596 length:240 start_codon:yes stop_codon:yes gene_type:complete
MKSLKKKNKNLIKLKKIFFDVKKKEYKKNFIIFEILDSIEILNLILKIEKVFRIKISESKINEKNFRTLESINHLINNE